MPHEKQAPQSISCCPYIVRAPQKWLRETEGHLLDF